MKIERIKAVECLSLVVKSKTIRNPFSWSIEIFFSRGHTSMMVFGG
jgi:hypothetical protein